MAKRLWNASLPVAANVGIIRYNRVDGARFRETVDEGWWRALEGAGGGVERGGGCGPGGWWWLVGKGTGKGLGFGGGLWMKKRVRGKGKAPETATGALHEGRGISETGGKVREPQAAAVVNSDCTSRKYRNGPIYHGRRQGSLDTEIRRLGQRGSSDEPPISIIQPSRR